MNGKSYFKEIQQLDVIWPFLRTKWKSGFFLLKLIARKEVDFNHFLRGFRLRQSWWRWLFLSSSLGAAQFGSKNLEAFYCNVTLSSMSLCVQKTLITTARLQKRDPFFWGGCTKFGYIKLYTCLFCPQNISATPHN